VRLVARPDGDAWLFEVETPLAAGPAPAARPGLRLVRQVVAAHGGRFEGRTAEGKRRWGFRLPGG
jgi:hypothetical protein